MLRLHIQPGGGGGVAHEKRFLNHPAQNITNGGERDRWDLVMFKATN